MGPTTTTGTGNGGSPMFIRVALASIALLIVLLTFGYAYRIDLLRGYHLGGFTDTAFGYVLALLPGAAAVAYTLASMYHNSAPNMARRYYFIDLRARMSGTDSKASSTGTGDSPGIGSTLGASMFLTASFLLVASLCDRYGATVNQQSPRPVDGIIFAGFGAYVSVIYYMSARMYANSLSSRFLTTSALRSASTIAFGWVAVRVGLTNILPATSAIGALFMCGLFYSWALSSLRAKAMTWFGAPKTDNEELPLGIVEGLDDTTADLLGEYGATTIQHLTTCDPADMTRRTLIPIDRLVDWVDQANLIRIVKRNIVSLRAAGIRFASDLAVTDDKQLKTLADKAAMSEDAIISLADRFANDFDTRLFFEFREGRVLPARNATASGSSAAEVARIPVKETTTTVTAAAAQ